MNYRIMKKYIVYILAFGIAVYANYLIRESLSLTTNMLAVLLPGSLGFGVVWLYGRIKNNKK